MYLGTIPAIFKLEYWVEQNWGLESHFSFV